jgi:hypothetical protein
VSGVQRQAASARLLIEPAKPLTLTSRDVKTKRHKCWQGKAMSTSSPLTSVIEDLNRAIDGIEHAVLRQATKSDLVSELAVMRIDRNKLAEALDDALVRVRTLDAARMTATQKIDGSMTVLRALLAKEGKA